MADRLERLVNLTATLLDTRRPLSLDELSERVEPRYPEDKASRRRQFERDKETLRELGVPIRVETVDGFGAEQAYRIHPDDYYLPELSLTEPELAALHVAVTAVRLEGDAGREGLAKLGGLAGEGADTALAELDVSPGLAVLFDAVSRRATVTFSYRGRERHLYITTAAEGVRAGVKLHPDLVWSEAKELSYGRSRLINCLIGTHHQRAVSGDVHHGTVRSHRSMRLVGTEVGPVCDMGSLLQGRVHIARVGYDYVLGLGGAKVVVQALTARERSRGVPSHL